MPPTGYETLFTWRDNLLALGASLSSGTAVFLGLVAFTARLRASIIHWEAPVLGDDGHGYATACGIRSYRMREGKAEVNCHECLTVMAGGRV